MKNQKSKIKKVLKNKTNYTWLLLIFNFIIWPLWFNQSVAYFDDVLRVQTVNIKKSPEMSHVTVLEPVYGYNQEVPVNVVKDEITKQSKEFKLDENFMLNLAFCESGFNSLAKNPDSTAKGIYQFVVRTWDATMSGKKKISPYDHKANIREAMLKIANGEYSHWVECIK